MEDQNEIIKNEDKNEYNIVVGVGNEILHGCKYNCIIGYGVTCKANNCLIIGSNLIITEDNTVIIEKNRPELFKNTILLLNDMYKKNIKNEEKEEIEI